MLLTGVFRDLNDDVYTLYILTNGDRTETITIGENDESDVFFDIEPIKIEENNDDEFETIIRKSCSIGLVTKKYLGDKLFADKSRNVIVNIYKGNKIVFAGYEEPNIYSQPYTDVYDTLSINCTDGLSTLQYYYYLNANKSVKDYELKVQEAGSATFYDMLYSMLQETLNIDVKGNTTGKIYYDLSKGLEQGKEKTIFEDLSMSELYLLGDDIDSVWTYEDVLKEILQYLNLHIRQEGFDYYIFDWDNIRKRNTKWYDIVNKTEKTMQVNRKELSGLTRGSSDTNLTISDVYNQVQVKDELQSQETIIESPLDDDNMVSKYTGKQLYCTEYSSIGEGETARNAFHAMVRNQSTTYDEAKETDWFIQVMTNKHWKFYCNDNGTKKTIDEITDENSGKNQWNIPYKAAHNRFTPVLCKFGKNEHNSKATDNSVVNNISMDNYLYISCNGINDKTESATNATTLEIYNSMPIAEYIGNKSGGVFSPVDDSTTNYLVFSGKLQLQPITYESADDKLATPYKCIRFGMAPSVTKKMYQLGYAGTYDDIKKNNVMFYSCVNSDDNDDGRYYTRKFYKMETPTLNNADTDYIKADYSLQPPYEVQKEDKILDYDYSQYGEQVDRITKLPVIECELSIGGKYCVEWNTQSNDGSTTLTRYYWFTQDEIKSGEVVRGFNTSFLQYTDDSYVDDGWHSGTTAWLHTFTLGVNPKIDDKIIGQEYDISNTIDYTMNLDKTGTAIPIKMTDKLNGKVTFKILGLCNTMWNRIVRKHPTFFRHTSWSTEQIPILSQVENVIIKEFKCEIATNNGMLEVNEDKDLIYMSAENDNFISKKDNITFKFITQLDSIESYDKGITPSINMNAVIDNTTGLPIRGFYNAATGEGMRVENTDNDKRIKPIKAEEHYVDQYYRQYSSPMIEVNTDLFETHLDSVNFTDIYHSATLNRDFFVESYQRDLSNSTVTLKLKELKL